MLMNKKNTPYPSIIAHITGKVNTFYAFLVKTNNFSAQNVVKFTTKYHSFFTFCNWKPCNNYILFHLGNRAFQDEIELVLGGWTLFSQKGAI